jgi:hypothetical protein
MAPQITGEITMIYETKKQLQERFIDEFLRRLREAPDCGPLAGPR